jgi:hypothetical protein
MNPPEVNITLPYDPSPATKAAINEELGFVATFAGPGRGINDDTTYILVAAALGPLWAAMAEIWGQDAARAAGRWIRSLYQSDPTPRKQRSMELLDADNPDVGYVIDEETTSDEDALPALLASSTNAYAAGTRLRWNAEHRAWLPEDLP